MIEFLFHKSDLITNDLAMEKCQEDLLPRTNQMKC